MPSYCVVPGRMVRCCGVDSGIEVVAAVSRNKLVPRCFRLLRWSAKHVYLRRAVYNGTPDLACVFILAVCCTLTVQSEGAPTACACRQLTRCVTNSCFTACSDMMSHAIPGESTFNERCEEAGVTTCAENVFYEWNGFSDPPSEENTNDMMNVRTDAFSLLLGRCFVPRTVTLCTFASWHVCASWVQARRSLCCASSCSVGP